MSSWSHNFLIIAQLTCGIAGYDYQSVRRWTTFKKLGYGLADCEKVIFQFSSLIIFSTFTCIFPIFNLLSEFIIQIFIPVHRDVHWCLAIINMKDKTFQYLDSLGGLGHDVLNVLVSLTTKQNVTLLLELSEMHGIANYSGFVIIVYTTVELKVWIIFFVCARLDISWMNWRTKTT